MGVSRRLWGTGLESAWLAGLPTIALTKRSVDESLLPTFRCLRFHVLVLWGSCFFDFDVVLGHCGDILVSFWSAWTSFGDPGPPRGPPKGPSRKQGGQPWFVCRFLAAQRGPFGEPFSVNAMFFPMFLRVIFSKLFLEGFWGLWGPPPTMKMMA